jgi:hypothetical protein
MMEVTLENELNQIVYQKIQRGEYPSPKPSIDNKEIRKELADLKGEKIPRSATKIEYLNHLAQLDAQLIDIRQQNEQITLDNAAARKAVDEKFTADIAAAKRNPDNQWAAIRAVRNAHLAATDWTQISDVPMQKDQYETWKVYRQKLRDIPQTYNNPVDVIFPDK